MDNVLIHIIYSLPSFLIAFFAYRACEDKVDIENDKVATFVILGISSFILCLICCERDIAFLSSGADYYRRYLNSSLKFIKRIFLDVNFQDFCSVMFLNVATTLGRLRYSKNYIGIIVEVSVSLFLVLLGINALYIMLFIFIKFNLTFANNSRKLDTIIEMFFFLLSVYIIPNSIIFCLVVMTILFKNIKKRNFNKIFIYNRNKWIEAEKDMRKITEIKYIFIYFEQNLNKEECKEFLMFLDNISDNNNVIRIHDDTYAIAFTKIDTSFGFTDKVVEATLKSEIANARDMIKRRLYFPICEEFNHIYKYIIFEGDNFLDYKNLRTKDIDKNTQLFSNNSKIFKKFK